jgi:hypothetical protein
MAVKYEVTATVGEKYTDKDGKQRSNYVNMGRVIETKNGSLAMKLDSIPVGWDGWAYLNTPREKDNQGVSGKQEPRDTFDPDSEIPF